MAALTAPAAMQGNMGRAAAPGGRALPMIVPQNWAQIGFFSHPFHLDSFCRADS